MLYNFLHAWLGEGLLTSAGIIEFICTIQLICKRKIVLGVKWQHRRKLLTSAFHFNILQEFVGVFYKETEKLVQDVELLLANGNVVNVVPIINQFALYSINGKAILLGIK